jgi:hypothetical protein
MNGRADPLSPGAVNREFPGAASVPLRYWPLPALAAFIVAFFVLGIVVSVAGR